MNNKTNDLIEFKRELANSFVVDIDAINFIAGMRLQKFSNFHNYSLGNLMLAGCEFFSRFGYFPELLAPFATWKKVSRFVKKGQKGLSILVPVSGVVLNCPVCGAGVFGKRNISKGCKCGYKFQEHDLVNVKKFTSFKKGTVFDISQTDGDDLVAGEELVNNGDVTFNQLKLACPYPITFDSKELCKGSTDGKEIRISYKSSDSAKISTLIHEMAHIKLDHVKRLQDGEDKDLMELEAESVAYMVTRCIGFENDKAKHYINGWVKDNAGVIISNGEHLVNVAEDIMRDLNL